VECTLVLVTGSLFAGGPLNKGLDWFRFWCRDVSKPYAERTGDDGCTGVAEEGNACTPLRSMRPSLGLPTHETGPPVAVAVRRRRGGYAGHYWSRQAFTGESGSGGVSVVFVARGASASTLARGKSSRAQYTKGIAVPVVLRGLKLESVLVRRVVKVAEVDRRPLQAP
jgi:hypothetical protein